MKSLLFVFIVLLILVNANELKFKYFIFQESCFQTFFVDFDFFNFQCLKYTASKGLGYGLVYGSLLVKMPQLYKIFKARSVYGVSFHSVLLESFMNNILISYNLNKHNPFSIYGENVFLGISNALIILSFFVFSRNNLKSHVLGFIILCAFSIPFLLQLMPSRIYDNALILSTFLFMFSRLAQILEIFKNKTTGNLSFLTCFLNFAGMLIRLFTVWTQLGDNLLFLITNIIATVTNGFIVIQFFIYWESKGVNNIQNKKRTVDFENIQEQIEALYNQPSQNNIPIEISDDKIIDHPVARIFKQSQQNILKIH